MPVEPIFWELLNSPLVAALIMGVLVVALGWVLRSKMVSILMRLNSTTEVQRIENELLLAIKSTAEQVVLQKEILLQLKSIAERHASTEEEILLELRSSAEAETAIKEAEAETEELHDDSESPQASGESLQSKERRNKAKEYEKAIKDKLKEVVERDKDGRHHRTYDRIHGGAVIALLNALNDRGQFANSPAAYGIVKEALRGWYRYSRGRAVSIRPEVPQETIDNLAGAVQSLDELLNMRN